MLNYIVRPIKRSLLLIPGIVIAVISVRSIFPYFDQRLPLGFAILLTYVLGAYVLVPAIIRVVRAVFPPKHLPMYCVTPDGFASDPLNVGLIGTRRQLIMAMEAAGWSMADPRTPQSGFKQLASIVTGTIYPTAPVSSLYLFGRKQDLAFQIAIDGYGNRHHVRFWATTFDIPENGKLHAGAIHWHHRKEHVQGDNLLWMGAASLDSGFAPIKHNLQITHMIHPDTNKERELIITGLKKIKAIERSRTVVLGSPYQLANRALRGFLQSDGKMCIATLKEPTARRSHTRSSVRHAQA